MLRSIIITTIVLSQSFVRQAKFSTAMAREIPKTMKAVGLYKYLPISDPNSLIDLEVNIPNVGENDVLIEVKATAVNPVDTKIRSPKSIVENSPRILGWDGSGVIVSKGGKAQLFNVGDEVFFTGFVNNNGSNAQYVSLDEILVGNKPKNLSFEEAGAMPLTSVTAYESLYDRLQLSTKDKGKSILIINSAGGVGSIASQLARNLGLKVIGTASRKETKEFSLKYGAHIVLNHTQDLLPQLKESGYSDGVDYILINYDPLPYWNTMMDVIKPQGKICVLVDSSGPVDLKVLKDKSITLVHEMMSTRIKYNTDDKFRHHEILQEVSKMLESGQLKHTLTKVISPINAQNLKEAHKIMENKTMIGKLVLSKF
ncbi:zinc-type alcohol dehydrogenase-like protein SERP1785 [Aricia agestis]|uniref:zinc-type alcohol dehydrogenase-like protein SERP1785 n=1 Tax=Aricia agestis TaxID=91739 RepID=UPI001C208420|nr:zinc-type alcohol dehydrogenase-like protein SERP1785 [Aricia agestis]